jgi:hypothetical protein
MVIKQIISFNFKGFFSRYQDVILITALALVIVFIFWPILNKSYSFHGDYTTQAYPWANYLAKQLNHWEIPLWDPFRASGYPFASQPQAQVSYPFNYILPFFIFGDRLSYYGLELITIIHFYLAGLFTFLYI